MGKNEQNAEIAQPGILEKSVPSAIADPTEILESIADGLIALDRNFCISYVNGQAARINNRPPEDLVGKSHWELWPATVGTQVEHEFRRVMSERVAARFEYHYAVPGEHDLWFEIHAFPSEQGMTIVYHDITTRKKADEDLSVREERIRSALASSGIALAETDTALRYTWIENADKIAVSREMIGKRDDEIEDSEGARALLELKQRAMALGSSVCGEVSFERPGGKQVYWITLEPRHDSNGAVVGLRTVSFDITSRKQAEEALRQSEERLRYHMENSPLALIEWDKGFVVTRWSLEAERLFGWSAAETLGTPIGELNMVLEDDIPIVLRTMERLGSAKERTLVSTNRNLTKSGDVIHCVWHNSVLTDSTGKMSSVMSIVEDITAQHEAERVLTETAEAFRTIVLNSSEAVVLLDAKGTIRCASRAAAAVLGYEEQKLEGTNGVDLIPRENLLEARFHWRGLANDPRNPVTAAIRLRTKPGEIRWFTVKGSVVPFGQSRGYLVYLIPVTDIAAHRQ